MDRTTYCDLFEDEVAELLRFLEFKCKAIMDSHNEFYPATMICEDGIYTPGTWMYTHYLDGKRNGYVNQKYLINYLAHRTFTVVRR